MSTLPVKYEFRYQGYPLHYFEHYHRPIRTLPSLCCQYYGLPTDSKKDTHLEKDSTLNVKDVIQYGQQNYPQHPRGLSSSGDLIKGVYKDTCRCVEERSNYGFDKESEGKSVVKEKFRDYVEEAILPSAINLKNDTTNKTENYGRAPIKDVPSPTFSKGVTHFQCSFQDNLDDSNKDTSKRQKYSFDQFQLAKEQLIGLRSGEVKYKPWFDYDPFNKAGGGAPRQNEMGEIVSRRPGSAAFAASTDHLRQLVYRRMKHMLDCVTNDSEKMNFLNDDLQTKIARSEEMVETKGAKDVDYDCMAPVSQNLRVKSNFFYPWGRQRSDAFNRDRYGHMMHSLGKLEKDIRNPPMPPLHLIETTAKSYP
ncbi:uncharacterized protein LOC102349334 [Latimeria chalumnae]|uniref:uncharacterized protein LOC102349334 n=1 Tax=Latimeria chalumnae TaxID=7897 RepID=UPI0006D93DA9|nr:PREDICTED: uncharacterized protein LOC102349334 [Latimeria chalumnae]XP_014352310.1 PREDICTED: uncharacterized protein LOC102349334 [Latimeria chalumnae]XP_014352311.1 PREDICTED: uncharacterized protein LOC102349334 [Latimeria chalumnae]XP_014352312.1 PREDICTED: uncharacterized protein LOC102349334 [Latimeria chalumnae]|eukprot:XP_006009717.2 PREDICTED: uncharacterized protein LOC102349334 [Latimeria chalumnae]